LLWSRSSGTSIEARRTTTSRTILRASITTREGWSVIWALRLVRPHALSCADAGWHCDVPKIVSGRLLSLRDGLCHISVRPLLSWRWVLLALLRNASRCTAIVGVKCLVTSIATGWRRWSIVHRSPWSRAVTTHLRRRRTRSSDLGSPTVLSIETANSARNWSTVAIKRRATRSWASRASESVVAIGQ